MDTSLTNVAAGDTSALRKREAEVDWWLVQRIQAGEVERFDELVHKYRERIWSVVYHLTSNREDAADLTQDAFIKAFKSINRFQGQSAFFTWLYRIAVNGALNHLQKAKLRRFFSLEQIRDEEPVAELVAQLADPGASSDRRACLSELQQKLNEAMQKLSIKHRTVVTLFEIDGLSHEEIAEITGTSVGTVRSRLHYAKELLKSDLSAYLRT
ncbi:MAG: sigma-70 family RNA polymerase sigma factor [Opitutaceae bacterium]|jgi:RNA polymerase sigma-70 factor (ECF subfamily)|nr:sigma-70 family RNA polymerase sigma factor [Opitutaceae bacterium]